MSKLNKLNKKIRRLEAGIQKRTKKLAKLRLEAAAAARAGVSRTTRSPVRLQPVSRSAKAPAKAAKKKKKSGLTPEGRAKLAAIMKARWAAKKAAAAAPESSRQEIPFSGS